MASCGCAPGARRRSTDRSVAGLAPAVCLGRRFFDLSVSGTPQDPPWDTLGVDRTEISNKRSPNPARGVNPAKYRRQPRDRPGLGADGMPDGLDLDELADEVGRL